MSSALFCMKILFLCCCSSSMSDTRTKYYRDIDLFSMQGKEEMLLEEAKYPYLSIDSISDSERSVTFYYSSENEITYQYKKQGPEWVQFRVSEQSDDTYYYYDYITENESIVYLKYAGDPRLKANYRLVSLSVLSNAVKQTYIFGVTDSIMVTPSSDIIKFPIEKAFIEVKEEFKLEKGVLESVEVRNFPRTNERIESRKCYPMGRLSVFWYIQCFFMMENYEC